MLEQYCRHGIWGNMWGELGLCSWKPFVAHGFTGIWQTCGKMRNANLPSIHHSPIEVWYTTLFVPLCTNSVHLKFWNVHYWYSIAIKWHKWSHGHNRVVYLSHASNFAFKEAMTRRTRALEIVENSDVACWKRPLYKSHPYFHWVWVQTTVALPIENSNSHGKC